MQKITPQNAWDFRLANIAIILIIGAISSVIFYHIIIGSRAYLVFVADDFYYYFLPAKNLVIKGFSSFDGITLTNGYHPLWMLSLAGLYALSGGSEQVFFGLLAILCALSSYLSFRIGWKLIENLFAHNPFLPFIVLTGSIIMTSLIFLGMEITLTLPLYCYFLLRLSKLPAEKTISPRAGATLGFLASLVILSRLDAAIMVFIGLLLYWILMRGSVSEKLHFYFSFALGGILLPMYLISNYYWFGHFLTVSSLAKALKTEHAVNFSALGQFATDPYALGGLILVPLALAVFFLSKKILFPNQKKIVCLTALLFPVFSVLVFFSASDWTFLRWYFYPFPPSFLIAAAMVSENFTIRFSEKIGSVFRTASLIAGIAVALYFGSLKVKQFTISWNHPNTVYAIANAMQPFVSAHPGIYAMGDLAGLTAYILDVPVIQLEGLTSDFKMYDHIAREDGIINVLQEYHVKYLIESSDKYSFSHHDRCYDIEEPHTGQSGKLSKKMHGTICQEPLYEHHTSNPNGYELRTYIFSVPQ